MSFLAAGRVNYPARIQRAELLAGRYTASSQILSFYKNIAEWQRSFYESLPKLWGKQAVAPANGLIRSELNIPILLAAFKEFLSLMNRVGPGPVALRGRFLKDEAESKWVAILEQAWKEGLREFQAEVVADEDELEPLDEFLARGFLQPYAEFVAGAMLPPALTMTVCRCPRCNSLPVAGALRQEGDGGKRVLLCAQCSQEWDFRRIFCASCGEDKEEKLPVYVAEQFPHIRMECCDTCKCFLRTIDLTKDGNAVPLVDDIAAVPLSLWADEHGYRRIQSNLLGT
jgi:formate dehydrogenase maturation protein FdhE